MMKSKSVSKTCVHSAPTVYSSQISMDIICKSRFETSMCNCWLTPHSNTAITVRYFDIKPTALSPQCTTWSKWKHSWEAAPQRSSPPTEHTLMRKQIQCMDQDTNNTVPWRNKKAQEPIDADPARNRKKTGLYNMSYDSKLIDWRNHALSEDLQMKSFHL